MTTETSEQTPDLTDMGEFDGERADARRRLQGRRDLGSHAVAYLVVNSLLVCVWAITGRGYFWPAWVIAMWGAGLLLHLWDAYFRRPVTEADVDREVRRGRRA